MSACPFKIILGGVPVRVATPPQLAAYATQVAKVFASSSNSLSDSVFEQDTSPLLILTIGLWKGIEVFKHM